MEALLARTDAERVREYRYRFGQAVVFGLPVVALHLWGTRLGGREAHRWAGVLQALLAGWVTYVAAAGMLVEGLLVLHARRRLTGQLAVAAVAAGLYLVSVVQVARILAADGSTAGTGFHWVVVLLTGWSAWCWWRLSRRGRTD